MKLTNKKLKYGFDHLNERFFNNEIPDMVVRFGKIKQDGICYPKEIIIADSLRYHPDLATIVLLHEMVHAHLHAQGYVGYEHDEGHGSKFHVAVDQLYNIGAYEGLL